MEELTSAETGRQPDLVDRVITKLYDVYGFDVMAQEASKMANTYEHPKKKVEGIVRFSARVSQAMLEGIDEALNLVTDLKDIAKDVFAGKSNE